VRCRARDVALCGDIGRETRRDGHVQYPITQIEYTQFGRRRPAGTRIADDRTDTVQRRVVHRLGRPTGWVGLGRGSEKFPKMLKLVVYYVCSFYRTVRFVNL